MSVMQKKTCKMKMRRMVHRGGVLVLAVALITLSGCAGLNGSARGTHRGGSARADIFKISLPP